jgi:hypothetical protein
VHWKSETERNKYRGEKKTKTTTTTERKEGGYAKIRSPFYTSQIALAKVAKVYTKRERE